MTDEKPTEFSRWAAEEIMSADMMDHANLPAAHVTNLVIHNLVEAIFKEAGGPVDLKISMTEVRPGDYDENTFREIPVFRTGWRFRIEGEKRPPHKRKGV